MKTVSYDLADYQHEPKLASDQSLKLPQDLIPPQQKEDNIPWIFDTDRHYMTVYRIIARTEAHRRAMLIFILALSLALWQVQSAIEEEECLGYLRQLQVVRCQLSIQILTAGINSVGNYCAPKVLKYTR